MLNLLDAAASAAFEKLGDPAAWESLVINRRKPFTYRLFMSWSGLRICLHRFEQCDPEESFKHPHGWPAAFFLVSGSYKMWLGHSADRTSQPVTVCDTVLAAGSRYEITSPMTWHTVAPLVECYTIMINGAPWPTEITHREVRTTKGKDLEQIPLPEKVSLLAKFREFLENPVGQIEWRDERWDS